IPSMRRAPQLDVVPAFEELLPRTRWSSNSRKPSATIPESSQALIKLRTLVVIAEPVALPGFRAADHDVLDLGMRPYHRAEVSPLPFGQDRAHEVQVLR